MKGSIAKQMAHDSVLDWNHGFGYQVKRIVIPEADSLAITLHDG